MYKDYYSNNIITIMCRGMHIHAAVVMIYNIYNTYKNYDYVYRKQYNITIKRLAEKKLIGIICHV